MIRMHDGNCRPFTIRRGTGRAANPQIWDLKNGQLAIANAPILGWRIEPFAYDKTGIIGVGQFRPSPPGESPFGTNINAFPPATCNTVQHLRESGVSPKEMRTVEHEAPHPQCTCGLRIVHDVKEIARFFHRHRGNMGYDKLHKGAKDSSAVFAVRGLGLTARSVEFKRFHDPSGTVRTQHVALEAVVLLDSEDSFAAPMFKDLGFDVHVVDRLARAHEQSRCGHEFRVRRVALSDAHKLRLSQNPGADGSWKGNDAVEFGVYGAAGVLIRTQEAEPRYLLQRRAFGSDFGGTWSVPGGARLPKKHPEKQQPGSWGRRWGNWTWMASNLSGPCCSKRHGTGPSTPLSRIALSHSLWTPTAKFQRLRG